MRCRHLFAVSTALALMPFAAGAQTAPSVAEAAQDSTPSDTPEAEQQNAPQAVPPSDIIVTARKRAETLLDVPVAVSAVTGDVIERRNIASVRELAALTPGLNINSDAAGRAFVAIRGVGVTLVDSVQPGVGIFVDGIYQPNTSYLNNPLLDVERVEVLRGPQGTLYGKSTLGGAINVITRQPGNELEVKLFGSYAGPDDNWVAGGSVSGPIITDRLQARIAYGHRELDGFLRNATLGIDANPLNTDSISATLRAEPVNDVVLTINGAYDWVMGGTTPYAFVTGPTDYNRTVRLNTSNYQYYRYKRANANLEVPVGGAGTLTLIGAYDERSSKTPAGDLDFSPVDIARNRGTDLLITRTGEARLDTSITPMISTIVGLFYSRETRDTDTTTTIIPLSLNNRAVNGTENETYAAFGNIFFRPTDRLELSAGLRYDDQRRRANGAIFLNGAGGPTPEARLNEDEFSPRFAATYRMEPELMVYGSISRGFRGGGFNPVQAPFRTYMGDNVWTYELGSKFASADRRVSLSGAIFYNDYKNYIGLNSIAPAVTGGFTTVDLNSGDVESYGVEIEGSFRPVPEWTLSGGLSLQHARLTDTSIYTQRTGRVLASDRLTFQPDWNFSLNSDYAVPVGDGELILNVGLIGKGDRIAASLNQTTTPVLEDYILTNGSITYQINDIELSAFVTNAFDVDYMESYIEKTTLILAGLTPTDVGIPGDKRRYGVRTRLRF